MLAQLVATNNTSQHASSMPSNLTLYPSWYKCRGSQAMKSKHPSQGNFVVIPFNSNSNFPHLWKTNSVFHLHCHLKRKRRKTSNRFGIRKDSKCLLTSPHFAKWLPVHYTIRDKHYTIRDEHYTSRDKHYTIWDCQLQIRYISSNTAGDKGTRVVLRGVGVKRRLFWGSE